MLIDTHCHLDAPEFDSDRLQVIERARLAGVKSIVLPAVSVFNFDAVRDWAACCPGGAYALGIHPLYALQAGQKDLDELDKRLFEARTDPRLVAVGEIGLDYFVPELKTPEASEHQEWLFQQQLRLAGKYGLPVIVHVRRSQDRVLKYLRLESVPGGIAHAFNGSAQQAQQFVELGMALGFGGAMTFERAKQIRRLASTVPATNIVLETDAPDIAPAWLEQRSGCRTQPVRNEPAHVLGIAREMALLRQQSLSAVLENTAQAALHTLPRLRGLLNKSSV